MTLNAMRQWLAEHQIRLTKSLGQNFLHDGNQVRRIVDLAELRAGDSVLEIGPGLGPLTHELLQRGARVLAIEKDLRLIALLRDRFATGPQFELVHADALQWLREHHRDWTDWIVVSNLPYSVGSAILVELMWLPRAPRRMVVTLQLEVIQRLLASPRDPDYGLLTLLAQVHYSARRGFNISRHCFFPAPDVDSACARLDRRTPPLLDTHEGPMFQRLVRRAFSQRRKIAWKLLHADWLPERVAAAVNRLRLPIRGRAEELSLEQWIQLLRALEPRPRCHSPPLPP